MAELFKQGWNFQSFSHSSFFVCWYIIVAIIMLTIEVECAKHLRLDLISEDDEMIKFEKV